MRVQIWCAEQPAGFNPGIRPVRAKTVDLDIIPRQGDYIVVHDGWCMSRVECVTFHLDGNYVEITIPADTTGEFKAKAEADAKAAAEGIIKSV